MVRREKHIFATRADLEPGALAIEASRPVQYIRCDMSASPTCETYSSMLDIPTLGIDDTGSHTTGASYLVMRRAAKASVRRIPQRKGGGMYTVDQDTNPKSIVFWPGGFYRNESLICGHIGTISESFESIELYEVFCRTVLKGFTKVKSYHVGPEAMRLLDTGWRLVTISVRSPAEYDLRRD